MIEKIVAEWKYDPKEYFEENIHMIEDKYELRIGDGEIEARIDSKFMDNADNIINEINDNLKTRFLAEQVMTHKPFNLSEPKRYDLRSDGKKNRYLKAKSIVTKTSIGKADLIVNNKNGKIISDTKADRINKKRWFAETAIKHGKNDPILKQMLKSYHESVNDPSDELIHLYEIRDAVSDKFSNGKEARKELNITKGEWNSLGQLANKEPLLQGRHRGLGAGKLRKAEKFELEKARQVATKIIENYVAYLENENSEQDIKKQ